MYNVQYSIVQYIMYMDPLHFTIAYTNYLDFQIISCVYVANLVILTLVRMALWAPRCRMP